MSDRKPGVDILIWAALSVVACLLAALLAVVMSPEQSGPPQCLQCPKVK